MLRILLTGVAAMSFVANAQARGFHADLHAGVDHLNDDDDESATGALYGVAFGYDVERATSFYGVELTAAGTSARACRNGVVLPGDRACVRSETDSALVARAGAILAGGTRLYGLAGFAVARIRASYRFLNVDIRDRREPDGLRLGVGAEVPLGRSFGAKLEYRYTNLDDGIVRHQGVAGVSFRF